MKQNTEANFNFCLVGASTNVGKVRKANEDSMVVFETADFKAFVVCDGMGGHVGGQVASQTAVTTIKEFLTNNSINDPKEAIERSIVAANTAIINRTLLQPELTGMGSTCVMLVVTKDGKVYFGHVGDSRIYIVANRRIIQLTKDHSFVQMLVDAGQITKEQAEHHPRKNEITNALGLQGMQLPTISKDPIEPEAGNCFLLCSDGLTGMVDDKHIERVISDRNLRIQERAEKLIQMAYDNGGLDNITVELVEFALSKQDIDPSGTIDTKRKKWLWFMFPVIIVLVGLVTWLCIKKSNNTDLKRGKVEIAAVKDANKATSVKQADTPMQFFTEPVALNNAGSPVIVSIKEFSDNDAVLLSSIKIEDKYSPYVKIEKVDRSYITIHCNKPYVGNKIEFSCETKLYKHCMVHIPVIKVAGVLKNEEITVDLGNIVFKKNTPITINLPHSVKLMPGQKKTNDEHIKCDVVSDKKMVVEFQIEKYPAILYFVEKGSNGKAYKYVIHIKPGEPQHSTPAPVVAPSAPQHNGSGKNRNLEPA